MLAYKIHSIYTSIISCINFMTESCDWKKLKNTRIKDEWECAEEQKPGEEELG